MKQLYSFRISKDLKKRLDSLAAKKGTTTSEQLIEAIIKHLNSCKNTHKN